MQARWNYYTYGVAGALTGAPGVHTLNGTAAIAMTLPAPTLAQDGAEMKSLASLSRTRSRSRRRRWRGRRDGTFAATAAR